MTELADTATKSTWRKLIIQTLAGATCGFLGMMGGMWLLDSNVEGLPGPTLAAGFGVGLVYLLTSLLIAIGTIAPSFGAKALNVEDADEIEEQRDTLVGGSLVFLCIAILLIALTLAPAPLGAGALGQQAALILAGAAFLGLLATTYAYRNSGDELMRQANYEAANLTLILTFLLFGGWAMLNQLQLAGMFSPLLFVSGLFAVHLLSVFVVVGRRGMLKPR